jgi:IS605 OrfB family transposase
MQRTITLHLDRIDSLVKTIEQTNLATNDILKTGFKNKVFNKLKLHHLTYYPIRKRYPKIPSSIITTARDNASEMLKRVKLRVLPIKRKWSAIRYNQRTFASKLGKGYITLATVEGRIKVPIAMPKYFLKYKDFVAISATMSFNGKHLILGIIVEQTTPSIRTPNTVLGVDTGIINHAVLSNNKFFDSCHIRNVKGRYQFLRGKLQAKGTRSAKRKLRNIRRRETRFVADVNHRIANYIVSQPFDAIALEKLGIRRGKRLGRRFNKMLGNWSFAQLQTFIEYKAESEGKLVVFIDARFTSQKCSRCGFVLKSNRNWLVYLCKYCGFALNADLNASRNIANIGKSEIGRLSVNQPIVACHEIKPQNLVEHSYKPRFSKRGN